ncbi:MAG: SDR family oxidoreductase [Solirubrobacterales bacterium]
MSASEIFAPGLLRDRVCVVSGGGTGLGREMTRELVALGARVTICGRRQEPLEETASELAAAGGEVATKLADIRDAESVDALVNDVLEREGRVDTLVNNAGGQFLSPAEEISPKGFRTVTELNVQGTWQMTHAFATRAFIPQNEGQVISITLSPHNGMPGMVHSGAARAGVENMMRTLAVEWARFNVRTVAIAAGQIETETLRTKYPKAVTENLERMVPLGRLGRPQDISWLVAYLASPGGNFHSGSVITVDGARDDWLGPWPPEDIMGDEGKPMAEERRPAEGS